MEKKLITNCINGIFLIILFFVAVNTAIAATFTYNLTYDGAGRVTDITVDAENAASYQYRKNGQLEGVELGGTGLTDPPDDGPVVGFSMVNVNFGGLEPGTSSDTNTVLLTNTGNESLTLNDISVTGDFTQTSTCGTELAAGESCNINVIFSPAAEGSRAGTLTIASNADGSPHTVSLFGIGETGDFVCDFSASSQNVCAGMAVTFTDLSSDTATSWSWLFPGGTPDSSNEKNPTVVYDTPGTYEVTLAIKNETDTNTMTKQAYITVFEGETTGGDSDGAEWLWVKQAGSDAFDAGYAITTDKSGNIYVTGEYVNAAAFENINIPSSGSSGMFVAKYDSEGHCLWVRYGRLGTNGKAYGITTDNSGNVYVSGTFSTTAQIGGESIVSQDWSFDLIIAKYDTDGNFQWVVKGGGTNTDYGRGITSDGSNVYVTGRFWSSDAAFGTYRLASSGESDVFIAKYDGGGNCLWAKKAGGSNNDFGIGITSDNEGDVYVTGYFKDTATFGSANLTSDGSADVFVTKCDSNGNFQWAEKIGGNNYDTGHSVASDNSGNIYVTGRFTDTVTFGTTNMASNGDADIFIAQYDDNGNFQWVRTAGGSSTDYGRSLTCDGQGNIYLKGLYGGTAIFETTSITSTGGDNSFIAKYDDIGNLQWVEKELYGWTSDYNWSQTIVSDNSGNVYVTGEFNNTKNLGTITLNSTGSNDMFIGSLGASFSCPIIHPTITPDGSAEICEGDSVTLTASPGYPYYTWSNGETTQSIIVTQPGDYSVEVSDCAGCSGESETISITQAPGLQPVLSVTPPPQSVSADAGEITLHVANTGTGTMEWKVTTDASWLTVTPSSGTDDETLTVSYEANTNDKRTGSITITADGATGSPEHIEIIQEAAQPVLSVTPPGYHLVSPASGKVVVVIENTGTGTMRWTAEIVDDVPWLLIEEEDHNDGMLRVSYESNMGEARIGMIKITASGATKMVEVRQDGFGVTDGVAIDMDISTDSIEATVQASESDEIWIGLVAQETTDLYSFQTNVNFDFDKIDFLEASEDNPSDGPENFLQSQGGMSIGIWSEPAESGINISNMLTDPDCDLSPDGSGHIGFLKFHVLNMEDSEIYLEPAEVMFTNCNGDSKLITSLSGGTITLFSRYDLNEDGVTDGLDLELLRGHFMETEDDPEWDPRYNLKTDPSIFPASLGKQIIDTRDVQVLVQDVTP
ncbi:SBBP repeat-containing protein [Desulfonema magnum]|uniref:PKD domain-containing protein, DUF1573 n=1 Tax=Desulfonema magnum TaxID=45655 RepID=A0A975GL56_9BACT|nr:SBBP repeat-containing protein [Desulfonema magnum]QTA85422.1 PKD domain-containing protein, DUF1573 [Desulfonema magnum]